MAGLCIVDIPEAWLEGAEWLHGTPVDAPVIDS
jgi:hypothetical protein